MTFQGETYSRPIVARVLGGARFLARLAAEAGGPTLEQNQTRVLGALVSFHLAVSVLLAALYDTWFATPILVTHVLLCACWAFLLRRQIRATTELAARAQRAEEKALAQSTLLATLSHELRAPLNGILGMGSLLSRTPLDARQQEQLQTLHRCAENALTMVNDILDFARLGAGKLPIEASAFDPRAAVDEVLAMAGPRAEEKQIELFAVVSRSVPESVVGDMTRVRQALTNLVTNAVKFTAAGEVEVRVSVPRTGWLRFSVSDTGIGIDPSARGRLFAPFAQVDASITRDYGGSGLGLAISRRLVLAMGGSIDFESTPGIGSRFYFEVPARNSVPGAATSLSSRLAGPAAGAQTVAVVVPHGGTREGLIEVCEWLGCRVRCADDLSILEEPFAAAIIDGGLPSAQLEALATHPQRERILIVARATAELPEWPRLSLSWPVRQEGVCGALRALLRAPGEPHDGAGSTRVDGERFAPPTRVLVVEDTPVNQIVAEALLSELGMTVQVARDGEEALRMLQSEHFELVLMDCQLPTLSGFETTRRLRASLGPNHRTPVIALTGSVLEGDEATCREAGMDDYLSKPMRRSELIVKLERWLSPTFVLEAHPGRASIPSNDVTISEFGSPAEAPASTEPTCEAEQSIARRMDQTGRVSTDLVELEEFLLGFARQVGSTAAERLAITYRESVPDTASCLARVLLERGDELDRMAIAKYAHALRGAARSMGLRALSRRLDELERQSAAADRNLLQTLVSDVQARILTVCDALAARASVEAGLTAREASL